MTKQMRFAVTAVCLAWATSAAAADGAVSTRYGEIGVSGGALTFHGRPVRPPVEGNSGLVVMPSEIYRVGEADLVLVTDVGGSLCPARFRIVTATGTGVKVSSLFGNCGEAIDVQVEGGKLRMTQPPYGGQGGGDVYLFDVTSGVVTENGRPAR